MNLPLVLLYKKLTVEYKVLIVDDEEDIRKLLSYNFEKEGYAVYTASKGKEAYQTALKIIPDIIFFILQACRNFVLFRRAVTLYSSGVP